MTVFGVVASAAIVALGPVASGAIVI